MTTVSIGKPFRKCLLLTPTSSKIENPSATLGTEDWSDRAGVARAFNIAALVGGDVVNNRVPEDASALASPGHGDAFGGQTGLRRVSAWELVACRLGRCGGGPSDIGGNTRLIGAPLTLIGLGCGIAALMVVAKRDRAAQPPVLPISTTLVSDDVRQRCLQEYLSHEIVRTQARIETVTPYSAVVVSGRRVNHILHLLVSVLLCGLWLPMWLMIAVSGGEKRSVLMVDQFGKAGKPGWEHRRTLPFDGSHPFRG
jgi:hypothetical protein